MVVFHYYYNHRHVHIKLIKTYKCLAHHFVHHKIRYFYIQIFLVHTLYMYIVHADMYMYITYIQGVAASSSSVHVVPMLHNVIIIIIQKYANTYSVLSTDG